MVLIALAERALVPDAAIRFGVRRLLTQRLRSIGSGEQTAEGANQLGRFADLLRASPLAVDTSAANEQHYDVPAEFFQQLLGPRLKYSACYFSTPSTTLADAEEDMLRKTCERAQLENGMRVLELGCGWGSLTFWVAEQFPQCQVTAVSNSVGQRKFIEQRAQTLGLANIQVITADMRDFAPRDRFDRIVSVEMFEHMRNYELLLHRLSTWLVPQGKAFVHLFCHRDSPYLFQDRNRADWMARHFFTGGMMPSEDLLGEFDDDLTIEQQWRVNGLHYARTCEAWLEHLDLKRETILARFCQDLPARTARVSLQRWRMFLMACAELFRFGNGEDWFVAHYRLRQSDSK